MEVTTEAIKDYVFGDRAYINYYEYCIDTLNAADAIYDQMKDHPPNDLEYIKEKCMGWINGGPEMGNFRKGTTYDWEAYQDAMEARREEFIKEFMAKANGKDVYAFEFSDSGGECALEHGGTFDRVLHEQISNH